MFGSPFLDVHHVFATFQSQLPVGRKQPACNQTRGSVSKQPNTNTVVLAFSFSPGTSRGFFNRAREVEVLSALLKRKPRFTVLLGPPSSGKTALARHVISKTRPDNTPEFHPLTINLHAVDKNGSFLKAFMHQGILAGLRDGFWKDVLSGSEFSIGSLSFKSGKMIHSAETAANIFDQLANRLKPWSPYHGNRPPVLVIDEANAFKRMGDEVSPLEIDAFLNFAVQITKQEAKMHVIFTLFDSFFESWLKQRVNPTHFCTLVVGDLPRQEAHNYFLHMVENDQQLSKEKKDILSSIDFDIPFKMTGGRMFFLEQYIEDVCSSGYFDDPIRFEPVQLAYTVMEADLVGKAKTYSEKEALTRSEEMIERNFLHFRPVSNFSRDLIPLPLIPVVTAQSEPALRAMEMFVKNYGQHGGSRPFGEGSKPERVRVDEEDGQLALKGQIREADQRLEPTILPRYNPQRPQYRDQDDLLSFRDEEDYRHVSFFSKFRAFQVSNSYHKESNDHHSTTQLLIPQ
ncbi:uncharacterized protein VP01_140g6 [Puccinia sorghi]|uniref:ATPase domain-containing protein n=1 Tax=Puccinia sorghi TaxID=27349 RepID=A0A0L6VKU7_9BASI|nr:uncharacterized protein VP01_140g6 [Puccinia sorghi]